MQPDGIVRLTSVDFQRLADTCRSRYGPGWGVQHRRAKLREVAAELKAFLIDWRLALEDPESGMVFLMPTFGRVTGEYPAEFDRKLSADKGWLRRMRILTYIHQAERVVRIARTQIR